ncbi:RNA-binding S4 domain-containing protein [Aureibaculum sp. 2210JD6-5]|uniref:RNA-binding S4 domain-containing protein n=1 Tax=Aureibaculum sp. 2210JD6-5 TaxID=3103957 RepID=UPI002AAE3DF5|nr:RNA-binding S4 domain-containing protein [Aureibaculum sp. 2210JD6-5]MDY7394114.1 RNA-binding S4 domain-containing protein [Aureibaculum sp. 2210JD6-5]
MKDQIFKLRAGQPYITLNKLLQVLGIAQTGGHAKIMILNDEVMVNGLVERRVRNKLVVGDVVNVSGTQIVIEQ